MQWVIFFFSTEQSDSYIHPTHIIFGPNDDSFLRLDVRVGLLSRKGRVSADGYDCVRVGLTPC